jgi:hypothetical protein
MHFDVLLYVQVATLTWVIGTCVILINMFYLISGLIHWFTNTALPITRIVFLGIIGVAALMAYIGFILYLALRTDRAETYNSPERVEIIMDELNENVVDNPEEGGLLVMLPRDNIV